jgi:sugar O-acyltransferase (sialic acid O-acetyltransferase NeuD family)
MSRPILFVVVGAGGLGQEVVWAARNVNEVKLTYEILGFCDDDPAKKGTTYYGCRVAGTPEELDRGLEVKPRFLCAIGENATRAAVVARLKALGWSAASVIDPSVIVGDGVKVDLGTYVGAGSILSPNARVGSHVIINHHCSIGHDSVLDDFVQVSPGGRVSGGCHLVEGATLGSNAVVAPGRSVGRYSTLGACSFALVDVPDHVMALGNPARVFRRNVEPAP